MAVRAAETLLFYGCLHAGHPDSSQRVGHFVRIEFLVLLAAEELLDQKVVGHHAQKASRRYQRISPAKNTEPYPLANVAGEGFIVVGDEGPKEARGELMFLERREPEQAGKLTVPRRA